ncbi:AMP-binding protein [Nakamurella sp. YIM 132087]|uniref:AMP-binding protein n=1 Tax=Nakamurella alba TaxID=2665158 RepID=A0A7K1FJ94_9ACTN|nr:TIGR03089 family protein [Nakamurella alba]MTD14136.1 AMP-binding protein [Nakamurella alba]
MRELGGVTGRILGPLQQGDPHRPRLTVLGADGARTELSTASLANLAAKVAGLLRDEIGATEGDVAAVLLDRSWQTAPILLGCWWAGLTVGTDDDPAAVAAFVPEGADAAVGAADEVFVVTAHPLGLPSAGIAAHQRDFTTAAMPQADRFGAGRVELSAPAPALDAVTGDDLLAAAADLAASWGTAARVAARTPCAVTDLAPLLLGALLADGSLLLAPDGVPVPDGEQVTVEI